MQKNFQRMIELADKVFDVRHDPGQISVTEQERNKLARLHPTTLSQLADGNGPYTWVLIFPTTHQLMTAFINGDITEKELLEQTPENASYDAIYLCSALTLEEYRHQGNTRKLTIDAINQIRKDHPIKFLFVWPFTNEGDLLSEGLAEAIGLPLLQKK